MNEKPLRILYKNYKGKISVRNIGPKEINFGKNKFHTENQWFLVAWDYDKNTMRSFAMNDILRINPTSEDIAKYIIYKSPDEDYIITNDEKPPLGLKPKKLFYEERFDDIINAMHRYIEAKKIIPKEWIVELNELTNNLCAKDI